MRDYPYQPGPGEKPIGVVRLLEDTDGDGTLDQSHVFADELLWTTGVTVWKGGVFVTAPPDIWYLKDTDGDAKADIRKKVYSGFGHQNEQQMMNSIIMGVDHWIYGIASGNAGEIRSLENPDSPPVSLGARDFRFDPVSGRFETTTQTFQFGHSFDEWYNRFVCNQGMPGRHVVLPARYLERNPYLFVNLHRWLGPGANQVKPLVQGQTRLYKISPVEGWRTIRQARRIFAGSTSRSAGVGHDYLTAGSGVTMYTGHAYPEKYRGSYFMGANTGNLIHRRVLIDDGVTFRSERGDAEGSEFVRTADNWFRPVNAVNAPDGTVYFLDMSRELIEATHVPGRVMKHLDFTSGRDRGRIYRLAPPGFVSPPPPRLGEATTEELVAHLEHDGGWWRATAHRLIRERQDRSAAPLLRRLLRESSRPLARMHALWSLEGLGSLRERDLLRGLGDPEAGVRVHAVRLAESRLESFPRPVPEGFGPGPGPGNPGPVPGGPESGRGARAEGSSRTGPDRPGGCRRLLGPERRSEFLRRLWPPTVCPVGERGDVSGATRIGPVVVPARPGRGGPGPRTGIEAGPRRHGRQSGAGRKTVRTAGDHPRHGRRPGLFRRIARGAAKTPGLRGLFDQVPHGARGQDRH